MDIQILITVDVGELGSERQAPCVAEIRSFKAALAVVQKHAAPDGSMPALGEHEIEIAIAVQIAHRCIEREIGHLLSLRGAGSEKGHYVETSPARGQAANPAYRLTRPRT